MEDSKQDIYKNMWKKQKKNISLKVYQGNMKRNYKYKIQLGLKIYFLKVSRPPHIKFDGMVYPGQRQFLKDGVT
jgi:hypothetical protein